MSKPEMDSLVRELFCGPKGVHGNYEVPGGSAGAEVSGAALIHDTVFRYDLMDSAGKPVTLQTYWDVSQLGGRLWDQEIRILVRASATRHPALPAVLGGGYAEPTSRHSGFAYVVTEGFNERLVDDEHVIPFMRENPEEAVGQLSLLADALSILHSTGVVHRNIWPGTVDLDTSAADSLPRLKLSRFEMSRLVSDLLRSQTIDARRTAEVRNLFLGQGLKAIAYVAPERLELLYPTGAGAAQEDGKSDVFSLGMLASEWFLGPLPDPVADMSDHAGARAWVVDVQRERRRRLRLATELPAVLAELLHDMVDPTIGSRPAAAEVVARISKHHQAMTDLWSGAVGRQPHLVGFQPAEFRATLWQWGWISADPATNEGRVELADFIERDLRRGSLAHSPGGAASVVATARHLQAAREAQQVLIGERALWFCRPYREVSAYGGQGTMVDEVLMVRYVVSLDREGGRTALKALRRLGSERSLPAVEVVGVDLAKAELKSRTRDRPSWRSLIRATRRAKDSFVPGESYGQALEWLVAYQWVELRAREYAYVRERADGEIAVVRFDEDRDSARRYRSTLSALYASSESRRPPFVEFFKGLGDEDDEDQRIEVVDDNGNEPGRSSGLRARFEHDISGDAIVLRVQGGANRLPERGWLRPAADRGTKTVLLRQEAARQELLQNRVLMAELRRPRGIEGRRSSWAKAPRELRGDGREAVVDILVNQTLFALQGPPGTGKTTVAAHAIAAHVSNDPGRVLVAAQSNHALDNLAHRVLELVDAVDERGRPREESEVIALRIASAAGSDRVDEVLKPFRLVELTKRRARALRQYVEAELAVRRSPAALDVLQHWKAVLDGCEPELADRLRRGANLVFATCAAATPDAVSRSGASSFDWVVVEEAAKAWPTELAIPLVRGLRWTLIGDQRQLPAHRRREVEDFLRLCAMSEDIALDNERVDEFGRFFDLFGSLFEAVEDRGRTSPGAAARTLTTQYRMREPISQVVSRVFYPVVEPPPSGELPPGLLTTGREDSPAWPVAPEWLRGRSLLWLDTDGVDGTGDEPSWSNPAEAKIVCQLIARLRPRPVTLPTGGDRKPIAVLTPYREQAKLLSQYDEVRPYVHTMHAFQGREADVVIASMVRDTVRGGVDKPWRSIGHLTQPHLVNVMLSRARDLLVVVGNLPHLEQSGSETWARLGPELRRYGTVLRADEVIDR